MACRLEAPAELMLYFSGILLIAWMFSLGPAVNILGSEFKTPFHLLNKVVPGFESLRAPCRFGMFLGLPLAVLAMGMFPALFAGKTRSVLGIVSLLLLIADAWCTFPVYSFSIAHRDFYSRAASQIAANEPVLVLPASTRSHTQTVRLHMEQLKGSTIHWGRIVTGHGSRLTPEICELYELDRRFQSGHSDVNSLLDFAARLHIRKVVVFLSDYGAVPRQSMENYFSSLDAGRIILRDKDAVLFSLPD